MSQIQVECRRQVSLHKPLKQPALPTEGPRCALVTVIAQSTVSIYMVPRQDRPLQTWKTFLRNHTDGIASIDLFVVPTIAFEQLFAFLVLGHGRRQLLWIAVTRNPTAEWLAKDLRRHQRDEGSQEPDWRGNGAGRHSERSSTLRTN
jgi:hypothetical protein